jgi:transposase
VYERFRRWRDDGTWAAILRALQGTADHLGLIDWSPFGCGRAAYRRRNAVERCLGWLKESRRVATRYEKLAVSYLAVVHVAMSRLCLKRVTAALSDRT